MAKYTKLNAVVSDAWGENWRETYADVNERAGFRAVAAALVVFMGEMSSEEAFRKYKPSQTSSWGAAKRLIKAAVQLGRYGPLKEVLLGVSGRDVCTVGREFRQELKKKKGTILNTVATEREEKELIELFNLFDQDAQFQLLGMLPLWALDVARKRAVRVHHPDAGGDHTKMVRLNELWKNLDKNNRSKF
jgi:hypothetical protein